MIKINNIMQIKEFRRFLDDLCYDIVNIFMSGEVNYFYNPWQTFERMKLNLLALDSKHQIAFKLLLLGEELDIEMANSVLGEDIIEILLDLCLLVKNSDKVRTDGYAVVSYFDHYFLVGLPYYYPTSINKDPAVYIAQDTYRLTRVLPSGRVENSLDLCTGSGIQAILQSRNSYKSFGVELNSDAIQITKFNVILNNLEDKVQIKEGDLYEPISSMKFDVITSNPPFIPVPDNIKFSLAGDGGEDGLKIVRKIIEGYHAHLNDYGYGIMIGEAIGDERQPFLVDLIKDILGNYFETKLILSDKKPIESVTKSLATLCTEMGFAQEKNLDKVKSTWSDVSNKLSASYYYVFTIKTKKLSDKSGRIEVIDITNKWTRSHKPIICSDFVVEKVVNDAYWIKSNNQYIANLDEEAVDFINLCKGNITVEEIVTSLSDKYASKYGEEYISKMLVSSIEACHNLEKKGIIKMGL